MWGMNQNDTGLVIIVIIFAVWSAVMRLLTVIRLRGREIEFTEGEKKIVLRGVDLNPKSIQAFEDRLSAPRATAEDVRH